MLGLLASGIFGCSDNSSYQQLLASELALNTRKDSLFHGIYLGMSKKDFYTHCWDLNNRGVFHQGTRNTTVLYRLEDLQHQVLMDFYPVFQNDSIVEMPVYFKYAGWAPWNKHLFADSLREHLVPLFEEWYGSGFMPVTLEDQRTGYVKIDGNRRILLTVEDEKNVKALISDMTKIENDL